MICYVGPTSVTELISIIYIKFENFEVLLKSELDLKRLASEAFLREQNLTLTFNFKFHQIHFIS